MLLFKKSLKIYLYLTTLPDSLLVLRDLKLFSCIFQIHRPTLFYCASQILHYLHIEGLGQPCVKQVIGPIFPTALAHSVSLCTISVILNISNFSLLL